LEMRVLVNLGIKPTPEISFTVQLGDTRDIFRNARTPALTKLKCF